MKRHVSAMWLKIMIIMVGMLAAAAYIFIMPACAEWFADVYPELASWKPIWTVFYAITALPIAAAAVLAWQIAAAISKDESFTNKNSRRLKWIAYLAAADSAYYFIGNCLLLIAGMNHPGIILVSIAPTIVGAAVAAVAAALSNLSKSASALQEEAELTV